MARGPLPDKTKRRVNAPTIPTTELPVGGRDGPAPACPYSLGKVGRKWWRWAWGSPQAAAWDDGALYFVGRRAQLEDDLAALDFEDRLDLGDLLAGADEEAVKRVEWALSMLKRSATGSVALMKEMRELDNRLGLNPKGLADLRWTIIAESEKAERKPAAKSSSRKARLSVVA